MTVGKDATIGAGSVITKDAPEGKLTVARAAAGDDRRAGSAPVKKPKPRDASGSQRSGHQHHRHAQPAAFAVQQRDAAAVRFGDLARQRQAQAGAVRLVE